MLLQANEAIEKFNNTANVRKYHYRNSFQSIYDNKITGV